MAHTRRVLDLSMRLAQKMGSGEREQVQIHRGVLLHDIGNLGIPEMLLLKPGPLTAEERTIIRDHPRLAVQMLQSMPFLTPALDIPYHHHERWDGSGYPDGLAGDRIPFPARLFAVVDVYDALTSSRPYRPAWSQAEALAYICEQSGVLFDPQVAGAFLEMMGGKRTQKDKKARKE
jgi:HD-GYP domain-containing protein (c-di-GMP phosphodiesterase class II)